MTYRLNDCYSAIQGEGCQTGLPMVIVRLQGCGVGCPWCDTKETWLSDERNQVGLIGEAMGTNARWTEATGVAIAAKALDVGPKIGWVLLTGGEPAEQELGPLVAAFHAAGFKVAIETSGTATGHIGAGIDWVCVSPKIGMPGGKAVLAEAVKPADEIKMVIGKPDDLDALDALLERVTTKPDCQVCLQPVSCQDKATRLCLETCMARGYRLSVQVHKFLKER